MAKLNMAPSSVRRLFISHMHGDHVFGAASVAMLPPPSHCCLLSAFLLGLAASLTWRSVRQAHAGLPGMVCNIAHAVTSLAEHDAKLAAVPLNGYVSVCPYVGRENSQSSL